jgi:hypothetical protein
MGLKITEWNNDGKKFALVKVKNTHSGITEYQIFSETQDFEGRVYWVFIAIMAYGGEIIEKMTNKKGVVN